MIDRAVIDDGPQWFEGVRRPMVEASGLPAACYVDHDFHRLEQERVFGRGWVGVAAAAELSATGTVLVRAVAGRSVLIVRDGAGGVRGFLNSCRHRGTELMACDGVVAGMIRCPYHRWGYRLDGSLAATPRFDDVPLVGFDRADYGLHDVAVDTFAGVVFVSLDPPARPVAEEFGDLPARLAGYGLDRWELAETRSFEIEANWKLISENYQEYYHLAWVHPDLAKVSRVADHYRFQGPGKYCGQTTTPVSSEERGDWTDLPSAPGLSASDAASGRFLALFPNVLLSVLPNHAFLMILEPDGPGRTIERTAFLLPSTDVDGETFAATRQFWIDVNNEDIDIVERGQRGLTTGGYTPGRLSPRFEEPLHRFANLVADRFEGIDRLPPGDTDDPADRWGSGENPLPWIPSAP